MLSGMPEGDPTRLFSVLRSSVRVYALQDRGGDHLIHKAARILGHRSHTECSEPSPRGRGEPRWSEQSASPTIDIERRTGRTEQQQAWYHRDDAPDGTQHNSTLVWTFEHGSRVYREWHAEDETRRNYHPHLSNSRSTQRRVPLFLCPPRPRRRR